MTYRNRLLGRVADARLLHWGATLGAALAGLSLAGTACASDATADATPGVSESPDYGVRVSELVVTGESAAAHEAPVKAPLQATEPTSIITHDAIEQFVPQTGDYTTVLSLAPSMAGLSFNGPGLYEAKTTLRGFVDGQYNVTYDGIPFGDTNDPTHHSTSFFPSSNIGAVSVERGPGAAGQLGQENFGGSVNIFSPEVGEDFGASEQVTYGSWNTFQTVGLLNTGKIASLNDSRLLVALSGLRTDGALTFSGAYGLNVMARAVVPLADTWKLTFFASLNHTHVYQDDNNGATLAQVAAYGKNFALTGTPGDNTYFGINQVNKHTDFEYGRLNGDIAPRTHLENTVYTYYYDNQTLSPQDVTCFPNCAAGDVTHPNPTNIAITTPGHIPGYTKLNHYRVYGDVLRLDQDVGFGTIKAGVWAEHSDTHRFRYDWDLTADVNPAVADYKEKPVKNASGAVISTAPSNVNFDQHSTWDQVQPFIDFEWRPLPNLTVTPGFKWLHFTRNVSGPYNQSTRNGNAYSATYEKPLYFLTANYRPMDHLSVYGQFATGFLVPPLSVLQTNNPNVAALKPQETKNYQVGAVYQAGRLSLDADLYYIDFNNLLQSRVCQPGDATCTTNETVFFNSGGAIYKGIEGQATVQLTAGLFVFANGSINSAKNKGSTIQINKAPLGTAAFGAIYHAGDWKISVSDKYVADTWYGTDHTNPLLLAPAYNSTDVSVTYTMGRLRLQGSVYNILDSRSIVSISSPQYYYQPGRNFQVSAKVGF
jgi:iron complex outermembrane receptor protein